MIVNRGDHQKVDDLYKKWTKINHDYHFLSKNDARTELFQEKLKELDHEISKIIPKYPNNAITKMAQHHETVKQTPLRPTVAVTSAGSKDELTVYRFNRGILLSHSDSEKLTSIIYSMPEIDFEYLKFNHQIKGYMCSQKNGYDLFKKGICAGDYSDKGLGVINPVEFVGGAIIPITKQLGNIKLVNQKYRHVGGSRKKINIVKERQSGLLMQDGKYELIHDVDNKFIRNSFKPNPNIYYHTKTKFAYQTWKNNKLYRNASFVEVSGEMGTFAKELKKNGDKYKYSFIEIVLLFDDDEGESHVNTLIFDNINRRIFRFEPHGGETATYSMSIMDNRFVMFFDRYLKKYLNIENLGLSYYPPVWSFPKEGPQLKSDNADIDLKIYSDSDGNMKVEDDGYCFIWNALFINLHDYSDDLHPLTVFKVLDEKSDEDCGRKIREYSSFLVEKFLLRKDEFYSTFAKKLKL
jgi:hypothetical protein